MMEKTKHNEEFDKLLRSKYQHEEVKPAAHLWKNIQKQIQGGPVPVKPWYLSKAVLIGSSAAAVLGLISLLFYFVYLKPQRLSSPVVSNSKPAVSAPHASGLKQHKTSSKVRQSAHSKVYTSSVTKKGGTIALKKGRHPIFAKTLSSPLRKEKRTSSIKKSKKLLAVKSQNTGKTMLFITPMKEMSPVFPFTMATNTTWYRTVPTVIKLAPVTQLAGQKPVKKSKRQKQQKAKRFYATKNKQQKAPKKQKLRKSVLHPWSIEAFIMPEFSSRFVTPNPNYTKGIFTPSYFNSREHYTFNYSYGLLADYRFSHWLSIESGVSYYVYGVNFSTQGSFLVKTSDHSGVVYTSSGKTDLNIDHVDSLSSQVMLSSSSRFGYLSVPVILKFYPIKNLYINAGPTIDYFISQSNNWDKHDQEGDFNVESENIEGINRFNISFVFGIGYEKKVWKNLSFSINPAIRMHLRNLNPYNTVKTYPFNAGFRIYLRYEL